LDHGPGGLIVWGMPCLRHSTLLISAYNIKIYIHKPHQDYSEKGQQVKYFADLSRENGFAERAMRENTTFNKK
jgi:hypothetical protein